MPISQELTEAMKKTNELFHAQAVGEKDMDSLNMVYTSNARVLPPGAALVEGLPAIKKFWRAAIDGLALTGAKLQTIQAEQCGESIVETGNVELSFATAPSVTAKYVVIWKQEEGTWKWDVDIWNMNA